MRQRVFGFFAQPMAPYWSGGMDVAASGVDQETSRECNRFSSPSPARLVFVSGGWPWRHFDR